MGKNEFSLPDSYKISQTSKGSMLKRGVWAWGLLLVLGGCSQKGEGFLLSKMTETLLPDMKREAKENKEILLFGKSCLDRAETVEEANTCNDKIRAKYPETEMDDFSRWGATERAEVDRFVTEHVAFFDCILVSKTISEAVECREP